MTGQSQGMTPQAVRLRLFEDLLAIHEARLAREREQTIVSRGLAGTARNPLDPARDTAECVVDDIRHAVGAIARLDRAAADALIATLTEHFGAPLAETLIERVAAHNTCVEERGQRAAASMAEASERLAGTIALYDRVCGDRLTHIVELRASEAIWTDLLPDGAFSAFAAAVDTHAERHPEAAGTGFWRLTPAAGARDVHTAAMVVSEAHYRAHRESFSEDLIARLRALDDCPVAGPQAPIARLERLDAGLLAGGRRRLPPIAIPGYLCLGSYLGDYFWKTPDEEAAVLREDHARVRDEVAMLRESIAAVGGSDPLPLEAGF
ncbi:hypothetical protein J2T57_001707 [Natronocella acetinitrilica]|uniref:Uncharacterized protein n=1 Tax=Natronocella acetinitrilica TaxID=414046 RepID=A0AAE3G2G7_9GAMM|nr:hypothetical protein [Natronocella acetinitrilica]MCP1674605.1 hypothetical protein [Natronocella acetinitrilica]